MTKVEERLLASGRFALPSRHRALEEGVEIEAVLLDATESPIERPKKKQRAHYSGKKKRHTRKSQLLVEASSALILSTAFAPGRVHDVQLCREHGLRLGEEVICAVDAGYQGLGKLHARTLGPLTRPVGASR